MPPYSASQIGTLVPLDAIATGGARIACSFLRPISASPSIFRSSSYLYASSDIPPTNRDDAASDFGQHSQNGVFSGINYLQTAAALPTWSILGNGTNTTDAIMTVADTTTAFLPSVTRSIYKFNDPITPQPTNIIINGTQGTNDTQTGTDAGTDSATESEALALISSTPEQYNQMLIAHGSLMFLAWGVAPFFGIFVARYLKDALGVWWYRLHLGLMFGITGVFTGISFILIILYKAEHFDSVHTQIGLTIFVMMIVQLLLGYVSNVFWTPDRSVIPLWDKAHWWVGRGIFILAIANVYLGLDAAQEFFPISRDIIILYWITLVAGFSALIFGQVKYGQSRKLKIERADDDRSRKSQEAKTRIAHKRRDCLLFRHDLIQKR